MSAFSTSSGNSFVQDTWIFVEPRGTALREHPKAASQARYSPMSTGACSGAKVLCQYDTVCWWEHTSSLWRGIEPSTVPWSASRRQHESCAGRRPARSERVGKDQKGEPVIGEDET